MGSYTDNLMRRRARRDAPFKGERLTGVAIHRDGLNHTMLKGSHAQIRARLGDEDPYTSNPNDIEGFITSHNRFVTRDEAKSIGDAAGQCRPMARTLLSSDISW